MFDGPFRFVDSDGYVYTHSHNRMWRKTRSQTESIIFRQSAEASLIADRITRFEDDPILDDDILAKLRAKVASPKASLSCTGADANRNFDYYWLTGGSSRNPCSDTFAGLKPFSEPESRALRDLVLDNKDHLAMYISLHAYSQMWLLPWGNSLFFLLILTRKCFRFQKPDCCVCTPFSVWDSLLLNGCCDMRRSQTREARGLFRTLFAGQDGQQCSGKSQRCQLFDWFHPGSSLRSLGYIFIFFLSIVLVLISECSKYNALFLSC